jgi:hypothetical protein
MTIPHSPQLEPCLADYTALLVPIPDAPARVYVTAQGIHPTTGYEVRFQRSPLDVYPPEFSLWHIKPTGPVLEVLTPFTSFISFELHGEIRNVIVHDAKGRHEVPLRRLDKALLHA